MILVILENAQNHRTTTSQTNVVYADYLEVIECSEEAHKILESANVVYL